MPRWSRSAIDRVAVGAGRQPDRVDEPAAALGAAVGARQDEVAGVALAGRRAEPSAASALAVAARDARRGRRASRRAARAGRSPSAACDVGEPVVEAEPLVVHQLHVRARGPGCARCAAARRARRRRPDEHPPLPRRHLLVGVEGEGRGVAARARPARPSASSAPSASQRVLEHAEPALGGDPLERRHRRRVAEDVDRQEPGGALADRRPRRRPGRGSGSPGRRRRRPASRPRRAGSWPRRRS